jgi:hypothetical protein
VKNINNVHQSLDKILNGEYIDDVFCDACQQKGRRLKRNIIGKTPNVLFLYLQRLTFDYETMMNQKINSQFTYPDILDLKPWSYKEVMKSENIENIKFDEECQEFDIDELMNIPDEDYIYKLVGVNIHNGNGDHGHYWSIINTKRGKDEHDSSKQEWADPSQDTWRVFEDDQIKYFGYNKLREESEGGNTTASKGGAMSAYMTGYGQNAYMLVYERKSKSDIEEVVKDEEYEKIMSKNVPLNKNGKSQPEKTVENVEA